MTFRKATQSDAVRCLEIYDAVSDWEVIISSNQKSQAMYKKLGFWETGRWEGDPNGVGCTLVFVGVEKNAD